MVAAPSPAMRVRMLERCNYCSRFRSPHELATIGGSVKICAYCREWHSAALAKFCQAKPPNECQACHRPWLTFNAAGKIDPAGVDYRMYLVPKDGEYQVICHTCIEAYRPKRLDLYRGTGFAKRKGIC